MLGQLGSIIDNLYAEKFALGRSKKQIVFLIGNGIRPISNILNDDQVAIEAKKRGISTMPTSRDYLELKWRLFEYARYYSANVLPTFAHACIFQLVLDGICRDLITTNYDLSFDSIWSKYPKLGVAQNPVLQTGEYSWDGYYSNRRAARRKSHYWKIHGSLSHVVFRDRSRGTSWQIQRLPRIPISTNQADLAKAFGGKCLAPYLGYEAGKYWRTTFAHPSRLQDLFEPFIDWTYQNERNMFLREIDQASRLLSDSSHIAAIVLVGFTGYYDAINTSNPWNEELVPALNKVLDEGIVPVFMALHEKQWAKRNDPTSGLIRRICALRQCVRYLDAGRFAEDLFKSPHTRYFPFGTAKNEHIMWANHWFLTIREGVHV